MGTQSLGHLSVLRALGDSAECPGSAGGAGAAIPGAAPVTRGWQDREREGDKGQGRGRGGAQVQVASWLSTGISLLPSPYCW